MIISLTVHGRHPSTRNQNLNATLIIESNQLVSSLIDIYFINQLPIPNFTHICCELWILHGFVQWKILPFRFLILDPLFSSFHLPLFFCLSFQTIPLCSFESTRFFIEKKEITKGKNDLFQVGNYQG